nr:hypothetical protein [uncultured bacterium]
MQWDESVRDSLLRVLPYVLWLLLALTTSILVGVVREPLSRVLREAREQLNTLRRRLLTRSAIVFGRKTYRFWLRRQYESSRTVAGSLDHLAEVLPHVGRKSLARVVALQAELRKQLGFLNGLELRISDPSDQSAGTATGPSVRGSWWRLLVVALIAGLTGAANSFLLNEFFQGVLTADPLFPSALPEFRVSHVFAILIFMMEVAIGFSLHHFAEEREDDSPARKLLAFAPWMVLVGLVCLEGWAYALLSYQIDIPERLNLSPASGLYTFARYFLAVFGAGLTLLLASLGYLLGREFERLQAGSAARHREQLLRLGRSFAQDPDQVSRTERALERLRVAVQNFHLDLVHQFKREIDSASRSDTLASTIQDAIAESLDSTRQMGSLLARLDRIQAQVYRPVRTRAQAAADMGLMTASLGLLVAVSWVSVEYLAAFVRSAQRDRPSGEVFALVSGLVLTGFTLATGNLAGQSVSATRYASGTRLLLPSSSGRRLLQALALVFFAAAAGGLATVAIANHTLGPSMPLNFLFGLLHAGLLVVLGAMADAAVISTLHLLQLSGLYVYRGVASLGGILLGLARMLLAVLDWAVRVIAVFGQLVVRPRPPIRFQAVDVSTATVLPPERRSPGRRYTDRAYPAHVVRGNHG